MPSFIIQSLLIAGASVVSTASAAIDPQLVGTWSTKSAKVFTGPGFYNPVNDSFIEPTHTGISYSFTEDGFYESAYYRAAANPANPKCPTGIMQFQHGTVVMNQDLSLSLTPFAVDGRQLQSDPCASTTHATYTRYNQSETMAKWQVYIDPYTKLTRVDLYQFDGSLMNPMFLAYKPPQMLPTVTMNPTSSATAASKAKRSAGPETEQMDVPLNINAKHIKRGIEERSPSLLHMIDLNILWWTSVGMVVFGGTAYLL
ncbi:chaperone for protein-folding within the ER, fungal-domain-containing protein [Amylocarpus encephaloides]|uniref:Protein ROT1 n=1 Tax=Amylocarpus encephaloides TaxID=45428 RepID=A0A9P8C5U6_9HELO|nr:chaperone for protein-folding within the ER, fungal-domain-containing protein [Amylocarpus encephaloides]